MAHITNPPASYVIPDSGDPECGGKFCELRGCAIIGECGAQSARDAREARANAPRDVSTSERDFSMLPLVWGLLLFAVAVGVAFYVGWH